LRGHTLGRKMDDLDAEKFGERRLLECGLVRLAHFKCSSRKTRAAPSGWRRWKAIAGLFESRNCPPLLSATGREPVERLPDAGLVRRHGLRIQQLLKLAGIVAHRLHVLGRDLHEPAQVLV